LLSPAPVLQINALDSHVEDLWLGDFVSIRANSQSDGPWNVNSLQVVRTP
jgi:hypothetical protein